MFSSYKRMLLSLTLRNELPSGAEHEELIGFTFRYLFARIETDTGLQPFVSVLYQKAVY